MSLSPEIFLDFLSNFSVSRPGCYTVEDSILELALSEFIETGELRGFSDYELILQTSWVDSFSCSIPLNDATRILSAIDEDGEYMDFLSQDEIYAASDLAKKTILEDGDNQFYKVRRLRACAHTSKPDVRNAVFERDGNKCVHCGNEETLTVDHIIPVRKGGENSLDNYQTLCKSCNSKKGAS